MSSRYSDWVEVIPGQGALRETAAALLRLAGDPRLVRTDSNGTTFLVPPDVAAAFTAPAAAPPETPKRRPRAKKED